MGRLLIMLFCLLAPIGVYLLWITLVRRKQALAAEGRLEPWRALPWTWLIVSGIALMAVTLLAFYAFDIDPDSWIGGESLVRREGQG
mgnify:CR=1 FL=1